MNDDPEPTDTEAALSALVEELMEQRDALTSKVAHYRRLLRQATAAVEALAPGEATP